MALDVLSLDIFHLHAKFGDYCFSRSGNMIAGDGRQNWKRVMWNWPRRF